MKNTRQPAKPKAPARKKPIHPPLFHGSDERPFPLELDGKTIFLTAADVSELAQQVLYQAMLTGHRENIEEEFDEHGNVISRTTSIEHVPGDWRAAARWLQLQAQGAIN
mgnify:CR=1 FL=1